MTQTTSCKTGFPCIDELMAGLPMGQLSCIAARPCFDEGPKSSIMLQVYQQAILEGKQVLFLNMESTIDESYFQQLGLDNK